MNTETQTLSVTTSEEFRGEVTIYLNNKHQIKFPTQDLVDYVEEQEFHSTDITGAKMDYPDTVSDWLDVQANWDKAVAIYYKHVICK
jgi:cyclopropane fatty-acyl-phospholipid synthase-like methyltransferase